MTLLSLFSRLEDPRRGPAITDKRGDYVLAVKGNQKSLSEAVVTRISPASNTKRRSAAVKLRVSLDASSRTTRIYLSGRIADHSYTPRIRKDLPVGLFHSENIEGIRSIMPQTQKDFSIEPSRPEDIEDIQSIYAYYVGSSLATFEIEAPTVSQMLSRRAETVQAGYPYLVARQDGRVVGYAYANPYRVRPAYRYTVENSIYVARDARCSGIGTALMRQLIECCAQGGFHQMVAVIGDSANAASIGLHLAVGFTHVGVLRNVGQKFGRWIDSVLMQRELGTHSNSRFERRGKGDEDHAMTLAFRQNSPIGKG
jgi:phosphinothricin acetyltransferase